MESPAIRTLNFQAQHMVVMVLLLLKAGLLIALATTFGGADPETIGSIKYRAVREYAAQNRCVIAEDYDVLVRRIFPPG